MSDRYLRVFSLEENLYIPGSPVLISAGALLKDMQTGRILGQLKLQSISNQEIKAATVELLPLDTTGNPLGDAVSHQYLDLTISRDDYWGSNEAILFPDASTRAYIVKVKEVIFLDNSIWSAPSVDWKALPKKILLEESLNDLELTKQYRLHFGKDCKYTYQSTPDLWYCPCGTINHHEEAVCHRCKKEAVALSSVDLDLLQEEAQERIIKEREEEEARKIAHQQHIESQKAIWKKRLRYIIPLCAIVMLLLITVIIPKSIEHHENQKLNAAYSIVYKYIRENGSSSNFHAGYYKLESDNFFALNPVDFLAYRSYIWEVQDSKSQNSEILCTANRHFVAPYLSTITLVITLQSDNLFPEFKVSIPRSLCEEYFEYTPSSGTTVPLGDEWTFSGNVDIKSYVDGGTISPKYFADNMGVSFLLDDLSENFCSGISHLFSDMVRSLNVDLTESYSLNISVPELGFYSYQ